MADLKKEFGKVDDKIIKIVELKKVEQESIIMKEFLHEFRRVARGSDYKERLSVE